MAYVTLTKENFEEEVLRADKPVLVDFWAGWCSPCMALAPTVDEIADEAEGFKVGKSTWTTSRSWRGSSA